jgi:hypothetical protein
MEAGTPHYACPCSPSRRNATLNVNILQVSKTSGTQVLSQYLLSYIFILFYSIIFLKESIVVIVIMQKDNITIRINRKEQAKKRTCSDVFVHQVEGRALSSDPSDYRVLSTATHQDLRRILPVIKK